MLGRFGVSGSSGIDAVQQQVLMWDSFAQAWDGIIDDQRAADKLSNREVSHHCSVTVLSLQKLRRGSVSM